MPTKRRASTLVAPLASKRALSPGSSLQPRNSQSLDQEESQDFDREKRKKQTKDNKMRLVQAMKWLEENPDEKPVMAARIFQIAPKTVSSALTRKNTSKCQWGGHNKILTKAEEESIHRFIGDLLEHQILPTYQSVYSAIIALKLDEGRDAPSISWFTKWWKKSGLHKIKTKPIAAVRYTAQNAGQISEWFNNYNTTVNELNINKKRLWNFDEAGFR
ncbi:MAG: hypothetical protein M1829_002098, partial [Trizodia sp. TS-e1964]